MEHQEQWIQKLDGVNLIDNLDGNKNQDGLMLILNGVRDIMVVAHMAKMM